MKPNRAHTAASLLVTGSTAALLALAAACGSTPTPGAGGNSPSATTTAAASPPAQPPSTATQAPPRTTLPAPGRTTAPPRRTTPAQPRDHVISYRVVRSWEWPGAGADYVVSHSGGGNAQLHTITAGAHGTYDQMSFAFHGRFPSYRVGYVGQLTEDGSGRRVTLPGTSGILRVAFQGAQAHTESGRSSIASQPPYSVHYRALNGYRRAGDFEGHVTYGIGVGRFVKANPQTLVQVVEVKKVEHGVTHYVVAIQIKNDGW